jgi:membrane protein implicated in regulation of membrane protease activity
MLEGIRMESSTVWWVAAGVLIAVELGTGSVYLLMLALGACAGALGAHGGLTPTSQMMVAALTGSVTTGAWYALRRKRASERVDVQADPGVNLDIGGLVQVGQWDPQGFTEVHYRGANWKARWAGLGSPQPGAHRIIALSGNQLELTKA